MKALAKLLWTWLWILPLCVSVAFAQTNPPAPEGHVYTEAELDQMLAPIALYPDPLLSQILMAATYPLEVVQAARWSRANSALKGDAAVRAVDDRDWDPSVKSLVAFPQILNMMDTKLEWTERLGDAFLAQEAQVMGSVQRLRGKAYAAGNLQSTPEQRVENEDGNIAIEPSNPTVVYVPYYDPQLVYGPWWWPAYPPVYWAPWPGYYVSPGFVGITWGIGIGVGVNFFFGAWDWPHRYIRIVDARPFYYHRVHGRPLPPEKIWRHDPEHRRGVPYRSPVVRERFRRTIGSPEQRREFRGFVPSAPAARPEPRDRRPTSPTPERRSVPPGGIEKLRPNTPVIRPAPTAPTPAIRPAPESPPHVFEGLGRGQDVRRYSERGRESVQQRSQIRNITPAPQLRNRVAPPANNARDRGDGSRQQR
jgi:Protein of unknown function (DUF3300)